MKKLIAIALIAMLALCLTACGGSKDATPKKADVSLADVFAKFTLGEEMMTLSKDDLLDMYGIAAADVRQFAGAINTTGIKCDEIVLIEAVDADAAGRVKAALDARYQAKLNEMDGYLPDEYAIIKECSVTASGSFVAMIVGQNAKEFTRIYEDALK